MGRVTPQAGRRCAVLGSPVAHSLSPVLHGAAYRAAGLDWSYTAHEVRAGELGGFLAGLDPRWRGLSLTMPLKQEAVALADEVSERVRLAGVANTLLLENGRRAAHNTDITGAAAALTERWLQSSLAETGEDRSPPFGTALVLGGGATATSVLLGLADLGCRRATLLVREPARAEGTLTAVSRHPQAPEVDVLRLGTPPPEAAILVSTIPAAAQHGLLDLVDAAASVVFDVVYDPWPTPLMRRARSRGLVLVTGLDLLVHQAAEQFRLMTGLTESPLAVMRAAGEAVLT